MSGGAVGGETGRGACPTASWAVCRATAASTSIASAPGTASTASPNAVDEKAAIAAATTSGPAKAPTWSSALCTANPITTEISGLFSWH